MFTRALGIRTELLSGVALVLGLFTLPAAATTISATAVLDIGNGAVSVSGNGTTAGCINFYNATLDACGATNGAFNITAGSSAPFVVGDAGTIKDLPFNVAIPLVGFMTIPTEGFTFDLLAIAINTGGNIGSCTSPSDTNPGVACTPAGSPFTLTNGLIDSFTGVVDTVGIQFTVNLRGYTGSSSTGYTLYRGIFTTQSPINGNIDTVLTTIASGGAINASWSAAFAPFNVASTPEPVSFSLFGIGLVALGVVGRKLRRS